MPCQPEGIGSVTDVEWHFRCVDCEGTWSQVAKLIIENMQLRLDYYGDFKGAKVSVSPITGDLTIKKFQLAEEGTYKCQSIGNKDNVMELKSAGEYAVEISHNTTCYLDSDNYVLF